MADDGCVRTHNSDQDTYDDRAEWAEVLKDGDLPITDYPAFGRYCHHFFDFCKRAPYHVKRGYESGFVAKRKPYKSGDGFYHPPCFKDLVARHLDPMKESPWWLALRFGQKSALKCLDFDNKVNVLGHYEADGVVRPVARLPLAHIRRMKRLYDAFPNHIWCVSSATLGLHVWGRLPRPIDAEAVERLTRPTLVQIGLGQTEVYPSPQLAGQVLRRPYGLDYHTIAEHGLVTHWVDQLDHFERAGAAPPFRTIVSCLLDLARRGWDDYRWGGRFRPQIETPFASKRSLNESGLHEEMEEVLAWVDAGCPDEEPSRSDVPAVAPVREQTSVPTRSSRSPSTSTGRWSWKAIKELATQGVPEEHQLYRYLLLLARPLVWRDYYHLDDGERVSRAEDDLMYWVLHKHNGLITRVQQGDMANIRHEVRRQVRVALETTAPSLQEFYAEMRQRDVEHPDRVDRLADIIRDRHSPSPPVCCKGIIKAPDDTPLPPPITEVLSQVVRDRRMRRRDGEYPLVRFGRRLLNALWKADGAAALHSDILLAWCETKNPNQLLDYKRCLAEYGLVSDQWEGHVQPGVSSALYEMTQATFDTFQVHFGTTKAKRPVEGRFVVTPLTEARLAAMGLGW